MTVRLYDLSKVFFIIVSSHCDYLEINNKNQSLLSQRGWGLHVTVRLYDFHIAFSYNNIITLQINKNIHKQQQSPLSQRG